MENVIDIEEIKNEEEIVDVEELKASLTTMIESRDKKIEGAREHLIESMRIDALKFRTANGVMNSLDAVRTVFGSIKNTTAYSMAREIAKDMSDMLNTMANRLEEKEFEVDFYEMFLDTWYQPDFVEVAPGNLQYLAHELMILEMCQKYSGGFADIVNFYKAAEEEIENTSQEIEKLEG